MCNSTTYTGTKAEEPARGRLVAAPPPPPVLARGLTPLLALPLPVPPVPLPAAAAAAAAPAGRLCARSRRMWPGRQPGPCTRRPNPGKGWGSWRLCGGRGGAEGGGGIMRHHEGVCVGGPARPQAAALPPPPPPSPSEHQPPTLRYCKQKFKLFPRSPPPPVSTSHPPCTTASKSTIVM